MRAEVEVRGDEPSAGPNTAGRRRLRWWVVGAVVVLLIVTLGLGAVGWMYADEVLAVEAAQAPLFDTEVLAVDGETVTLADAGGADQPGLWGLEWDGGWAQVGDVLATTASSVVRPLIPLPDVPEPGTPALLTGYAFDDSGQTLGFPVEEVEIPGPLGTYPAWYAPAAGSTWAVAVHGRGGRRSEAFRIMGTLQGLDMPALSVSYRNDRDAPPSPDGRYRLGATEWEDVAAAVSWARDQGAEDVVLVGFSMGGAVVGAHLQQNPDAPVRAVILDAPVVDWGLPLRAAASDRGLPEWLVIPAMTVTTLRTGLRWRDVNILRGADDLDVPILLIHGDADSVVPVDGSDALAAARPDLVTYLRVPEAGHVTSWNVDREAYETEVRSFLSDVLD